MKIPAWMISEAMKHTEHYRMYAEVFGIDVPLTKSQLTESTQETYRTPSALRSTRLTPPTPVQTVDKADEMILQDTLQVNLAEHKSREEQEARENVELVKAEHQRPSVLLQRPKIPVWKWEGIAMDFVTKLPRTSSGHDIIWVIVDRLTKSAHFLPIREDYKMDRLTRLYFNEIMTRHGVSIS
nr:putative reverse transcriptase domain-containing protein [Tanacetum cinerariifolium]